MKAQLNISLNDDMSVSVNGCINDKVLAFGLLECAKDAIRDHIQKAQSQQIKLASPLIANFVKQ